MGLLGKVSFQSEEAKIAFSTSDKKSSKKKKTSSFGKKAGRLASKIGRAKISVKGYSSSKLRRL